MATGDTKRLTFFDRNGFTVITGKTLADILSSAIDTPVKIGVRNSGAALGSSLRCSIAQIGTNDGWSQLRIGRDVATLSAPFNVSGVLGGVGSGGIWADGGTVYYSVTALNATGETVGSIEISVLIDQTTKSITISWSAVTGATAYKVYRTNISGEYGATVLIAETNSATLSFLDIGTAATTGTPPTANTTAGGSPNYGSAPALSTTAIVLGALATGQWVYVWVARVVPPSVDDKLNPRLAGLLFAE